MKSTEVIKIIDIDELIPYVNNARTHSKEQITKLRSSLRKLGFVNPILIDKYKNILAGHGRIMVAKRRGIKICTLCFGGASNRGTEKSLHIS